jgi:hypothetical protein
MPAFMRHAPDMDRLRNARSVLPAVRAMEDRTRPTMAPAAWGLSHIFLQPQPRLWNLHPKCAERVPPVRRWCRAAHLRVAISVAAFQAVNHVAGNDLTPERTHKLGRVHRRLARWLAALAPGACKPNRPGKHLRAAASCDISAMTSLFIDQTFDPTTTSCKSPTFYRR